MTKTFTGVRVIDAKHVARVEACRAQLERLKSKYDVIYCDPPWPYRSMYRKTENKAMAHILPSYPLMTMKELYDLPVENIASPDGSLLLMWCTGPHMQSAIELMKRWGFDYTTVFLYWRKVTADGRPRTGLGNYTRSSSEFLLVGRRGARVSQLMSSDRSKVMQELEAPVTKHSQKPVDVIRVINSFFHKKAKKIELFARPNTDAEQLGLFSGWAQWGLDVPGFFRSL